MLNMIIYGIKNYKGYRIENTFDVIFVGGAVELKKHFETVLPKLLCSSSNTSELQKVVSNGKEFNYFYLGIKSSTLKSIIEYNNINKCYSIDMTEEVIITQVDYDGYCVKDVSQYYQKYTRLTVDDIQYSYTLVGRNVKEKKGVLQFVKDTGYFNLNKLVNRV